MSDQELIKQLQDRIQELEVELEQARQKIKELSEKKGLTYNSDDWT